MTANKVVDSTVLAEKVDRLWSIQQIKDLALTYAYAVDSRDWPLATSLWAETEMPAEHMLDIHSARMMPVMLGTAGVSTMLVANHLIEFDGPDRAYGKVYCHCTMEWKIFFEQMILYRDAYERRDGKWLFLTREHLLWWGIERENPMKQRPSFFPNSMDDWPDCQVGAGDALGIIRRDGN